jgi:hypothetical protein
MALGFVFEEQRTKSIFATALLARHGDGRVGSPNEKLPAIQPFT